MGWGRLVQRLVLWSFRVRRCTFSLKYQTIQPSEVFGARRKAVLRGEGNAWASVSWSFDKLCEVRVSPYLGFTLCLRVMLMFRLVETLNGHLIRPKTWDQSEKLWHPFKTVREWVWTVWVHCVINCAIIHVLMCVRPEMAVKFGFIK